MPGGKSLRARFNDEVANKFNNNSINNLTGYLASDHKINNATEKLYSQIKKEGYRFGLGKSPLLNQPVPFPGASETWMYLADHLSKENRTTNNTSDYIGFEFVEYQQFSPPEADQRIGAGNPRKILNKQGFPKTNEFYHAIEKQREEINQQVATERKIETVTGRTKKELQNTSNNSKIKVRGGSSGKIELIEINSPNALNRFQELTLRQHDVNKFKKKGKTISDVSSFEFNPNLRLILEEFVRLFPNRTMNVIRAIGPDSGPHGRGITIDFNIPGVDLKEVWRAFYNAGWGMSFGALEYCPNSKSPFIHIDLRGIVDYPGNNMPKLFVDLGSNNRNGWSRRKKN